MADPMTKGQEIAVEFSMVCREYGVEAAVSGMDEVIDAAIAEARAQEREACAKLAIVHACQPDAGCNHRGPIAAAIRGRK